MGIRPVVKTDKAQLRSVAKNILEPGYVMSELEFASNIEPVNQDSMFKKGDLNVSPNPSRIYGDIKKDLYIYYELYPPKKDKHPIGTLEIKDRRNKTVILKDINIDNTVKEQYIRLDITNLSRGDYTIYVKIIDGENITVRAGSFKILQSLFTQDYEITLHQLSYIASKEELDELKHLSPEDRLNGLIAFWKKRDPTPDTPLNETLMEFYRRIRYANEKWDSYIPGWQTDRGRIYIKYGPPDEIEYHPFERGLREHWVDIPVSRETETIHAYQIWRYYYLEDSFNPIREFIFIDFSGGGKYELYNLADEDR